MPANTATMIGSFPEVFNFGCAGVSSQRGIPGWIRGLRTNLRYARASTNWASIRFSPLSDDSLGFMDSDITVSGNICEFLYVLARCRPVNLQFVNPRRGADAREPRADRGRTGNCLRCSSVVLSSCRRPSRQCGRPSHRDCRMHAFQPQSQPVVAPGGVVLQAEPGGRR